MSYKKQQETVLAHAPNMAMRNIIGKSTSLDQIFTAEKIQQCQVMIDHAQAAFYDNAQSDLHDIKRLLQKTQYQQNPVLLAQKLIRPFSSIKMQADTFDYPLVSRICHYVLEYCDDFQQDQTNHIHIIFKLIDALILVFDRRLSDKHRTLEKELMQSIEMQRKYRS